MAPEFLAEKERLATRIAKLDAERNRLAAELSEIETTERVLARFEAPKAARRSSHAEPEQLKRRGRPRKSDVPRERPDQGPTVGQVVLDFVSRAPGHSRADIVEAVNRRPNHVAIALSRHSRGGRIEERDGGWYATDQIPVEQAA